MHLDGGANSRVGLEVGSGSRMGVPFDTHLPQCLHWRPLLPGSHDVRDEELCLSTFLQPQYSVSPQVAEQAPKTSENPAESLSSFKRVLSGSVTVMSKD